MKKETALKRIKNAVEKRCPCESVGVKNYIIECIYLFFQSQELDDYLNPTSTENLKYAIEVNLFDLFDELLREARNETNQ